MKTEINYLIVSFHIGRGGRFNNAGHLTFLGEKNFQDLLILETNNVFIKDRDNRGRFCKSFVADCNGNPISDDNINGLTGTLDFDGQYDTSYAKHLDDCNDDEVRVIANSFQYKSPALVSYLKTMVPEFVFDEYGILEEN